jgi:tetratricopeptide (TPR) repeat protein
MNRSLVRPSALVLVTLALLAVLLGPAPSASAHEPPAVNPEVESFLSMMTTYLTLSDRWVGMVSNPDTATYLALEGIVEIYEKRGSKRDAIPHLRRILQAQGNNRAVRNAVRFKIRDIYNDLGEKDKALEELDRIVEDNLR